MSSTLSSEIGVCSSHSSSLSLSSEWTGDDMFQTISLIRLVVAFSLLDCKRLLVVLLIDSRVVVLSDFVWFVVCGDLLVFMALSTFSCLLASGVGDVSVIAVFSGSSGHNERFEVGVGASFSLCLCPLLAYLLSSGVGGLSVVVTVLWNLFLLFSMTLSTFLRLLASGVGDVSVIAVCNGNIGRSGPFEV